MSVGIGTRCTAAFLGLAASGMTVAPAWAVQPGQSYLGLAVGASEFSQMSKLTASWPDTSLDNLEESDLAWKLYTGHQFSNWIAVETGWVDFGTARASSVHISGEPVTMKISTSGFEFSALFTASMGDALQIFARGGALAWRGGQKIEAGVPLAAEAFSGPDEKGIAAALGLGVHWDLGSRNSLRVEWNKHLDVAGGDPETWLLSVARRY